MATFKVGQRVRVIRSHGIRPECVGREATILSIQPNDCTDNAHYIAVDGLLGDTTMRVPGATGWAYPDQLAPLTDPRADEFIADMERFAKLAPKVPA